MQCILFNSLRDESVALRQLTDAIRALGGDTIYVVADVSLARALRRAIIAAYRKSRNIAP
jgi:hypothetical protein